MRAEFRYGRGKITLDLRAMVEAEPDVAIRHHGNNTVPRVAAE